MILKGSSLFLCLYITELNRVYEFVSCIPPCIIDKKLNPRDTRLMKRTEIKHRPLSDTVLANFEVDINEYRKLDGND